MKLFTYYVFLLFINSIIIGASSLDSLLKSGKEFSYQFEFQEAEKVYESILQKYPDSPYAPHYLSRNYLWIYLGSKDSVYKSKLNHYSKIALEKAESIYDSDRKNAKLCNLLGEINLQRSALFASEDNSMDAFWSIKSAISYFEESIELQKNYYDPYLGMGIIKYALSFVPGFLGWAITITGLSGDKEEGLRSIKLAYDWGKDAKVEASYHLGKIYTEYNAEFDSAKMYLTSLVDKYPSNILFLYQYAILSIDTKELDIASDVLNKIINIGDPSFRQTNSYANLLQGEIAFKKNNFDDAIDFYDEFLRKTPTIDYTGLAHFKIGLSCLMLKNDLTADKYFILARNGNLDIAEDIKAKAESYLYYGKRLTTAERAIILAKNNYESGNFQGVIDKTNQIDISNLDSETNCKIKLIKAKAFLASGNILNTEELIASIGNPLEIVSSEDLVDFYLISAQIDFENGDYDSSKKNLEQAFDTCEESNNKIMRLLINLRQKLKLK